MYHVFQPVLKNEGLHGTVAVFIHRFFQRDVDAFALLCSREYRLAFHAEDRGESFGDQSRVVDPRIGGGLCDIDRGKKDPPHRLHGGQRVHVAVVDNASFGFHGRGGRDLVNDLLTVVFMTCDLHSENDRA